MPFTVWPSNCSGIVRSSVAAGDSQYDVVMPYMNNTIKIADHGNTKMVAHRGVSGLETENTCAAFIAAGNRTYFGVETDIYRTADGKFVENGRVVIVKAGKKYNTAGQLQK